MAGLLGLLGSACQASGAELRRLVLPDQFHLSYANGRADIDSKLDSTRGFNEDGSVIAFGLSWNLSAERERDDGLRREDLVLLLSALREEVRPASESPPPPAEPEPEPGPAPQPTAVEEEAPEIVEPAPAPVEEPILPAEPPAEPAPAVEEVAPEEPPTALASNTLRLTPAGIWPWWPVASLAIGMLLAFAVYTSPSRPRTVRDHRAALASRAR